MTAPTKPIFTPETAKQFESESPANRTALLMKGCGCQPYEDWFTYLRWSAQGYHVKKGEHGQRLPLIKTISRIDSSSGDQALHKINTTSVVFCRHQVEINDS